MKKSRREFLKNASMVTAFMASGGLQFISATELLSLKNKVKLRFIVASDAHYGQPDTPFDAMAETFIEKANLFHSTQPCDFCVLNGDIIHDEAHLMPLAKGKFDNLEMPLYATKGNHDQVSDEVWEEIWKIPVNHQFVQDKNAFILVTTSDEEGTYLSPNLPWLKEKLEENRKQKNVFLFVHIPQAKWTKYSIDTPEFFELLINYPNVKAVFHGHEHEHDDIIMHNNVPFLFDAHIGGSWGTDYKGFRVVEVMKDNSIITYMMDPVEAFERNTL
ncbi:metallophosphoesterase [bacterium]|nr:metallophosphoesterase [bacterium]